MRPPRERKEGRARQEEQTGMDARPPTQTGYAPGFDRRKAKHNESDDRRPSENVRRNEPGIKAVADEPDIFVRQTERQQDEDDENNLEDAEEADCKIQKAIGTSAK